MGIANFVLEVEKRESLGKGHNRRLRNQGKVPAIVYGGGLDPVPISVDEKAVTEILKQETGENTIFLLKLKGTDQQRHAMIREIQHDPITGRFIHIDFIRIMEDQPVHVKVPVELEGDCIGVRHGGLLDFQTRELEIEVLPMEIPDKIVIDISDLDLGKHVEVSQIGHLLPPSGRFLEDPHRVIVVVEAPRGAKLEAEEEMEGEERLITEQAEPEVIAKGKAKEEE